METFMKGSGASGPTKVWSNAINTLLSAMESILLDEDLQSLWPRETHGQDLKKRNAILPSAPISSPTPHDPTFSPPLKRKKDPLPPSERSTKTQRMTDHLTARLAASLHVSPSTAGLDPATPKHAGLQNLRGFYRVQEHNGDSSVDPDSVLSGNDVSSLQDASGSSTSSTALTEPRKYRKATGNRSNPTTPVSSHPSSPGPFSHSGGDHTLSTSTSSTPGKTSFESFAKHTASPTILLDPASSARSSSLFLRRESRTNHRHARAPQHHPLTMATRLALFHRIISTTKSVDAQTVDKESWIISQTVKRGFPDRASFESAMASHTQALLTALTSLGGRFSAPVQQSALYHFTQNRQEDQEMTIYNNIQTAVDVMLESAHWLCGPDFEMGINRICPQWSIHEGSVEHIVHYVQVVESMRETLSGRFQHPQDLLEDLTRSQEVIDYQRTLFGETLRSHGLEWKALGLPPMEGLIQETQDWILNLALTLTVKIRAEMTLALESSHHHRSPEAGSPFEMDIMEDEFQDPDLRSDRSVDEVMDMVLQGALLSVSCLELGGKPCAELVTAWMELAGQYCVHALHRRKQHISKANRTASMGFPYGKHLSTASSTKSTQLLQHPQRPQSGMSRGAIMKTMEIFENVSRLLQCVQEMREEEEACQDCYLHRGTGMHATDDYPGEPSLQGISSASSDHDEPMDFISSIPASRLNGSDTGHDEHAREPTALPPHQQKAMPVNSFWLQRWMAMESLASTLVETGLELCESMAEILGGGYTATSLPSSARAPSTFNPSLNLPVSLLTGTSNGLAGGAMSMTIPFGSTQHSPQFRARSSSARAQAAIASLTGFAGGGVMASGTGGVGLIYVQFVVRMLTKMIEFAGQDTHQEQRLLRIHSSLQNLELGLSDL
ncbi:unnamed protein product [Mortierella alpina]